MRNGRVIYNIQKYIKIAIDLNDKFYKKKIERSPRRK